MKKIGIIGSGIVAQTLGKGFVQHGYEVKLGTRDAAKLNDWVSQNGANASVGSMEEAAAYGELVVLAIKGDVAENMVKQLTPHLSSKVVIDATNPIDHTKAPVNGVLPFFTDYNESLMERLQKIAPSAMFVKAFSCVGNPFMVNPNFADGTPSMFICGNDAAAKQSVTEILTKFGWETEDMGMMEAARAIEPLCILWCIPGFIRNQWTHAFKMVKK